MLTVGQIKTKIAPKLHGTTLAKVNAVYEKMQEASSNMLIRLDPPDTIQRYRISNAIYDKVYNYVAPSDMKGLDKILDIRPISPRGITDDITQTYSKEFDIKKEINTMAVEDIAGVKTLRISKQLTPQTVLYEMQDVSGPSGTLTAGGDASNLAVNNLDYVSGSSSISFDLSGATGSATLTLALTNAFDLSSMLNLGALFGWLNITDGSRITNVNLKWGSDASNYWNKTVTTPLARATFDSLAWGLLLFDWVTATKVGSPDSTKINYLQVTITYSTGAVISNNKIDAISASLGQAWEALYYSQYIFKDASTGALKSIPTADTDIITLDPAATNIFMYEFQKLLVEEIKGKNMSTDLSSINLRLEGDGRVIRGTLIANRAGLYRDYIGQNPSQAISPQSTTYVFDELDGY